MRSYKGEGGESEGEVRNREVGGLAMEKGGVGITEREKQEPE